MEVANLLVIDYNTSTDWYTKFKGCKTPNGTTIKVEQAGWSQICLVSNSERGPILQLRANDDGVLRQQKTDRDFIPDFILVRNFPSALHRSSYRNVLLGLMFCGLPSVNSLQAVYNCSEKPIVYGALKKIQRELGGYDQFPLIPQIYYPNIQTCENFEEKEGVTIPKEFPQVVKSFGKMKLDKKSDFEDFKTCTSLYNDYFTAEKFIPNVAHDLRLQKIGNHYRVYSRSSDSSWKNNWGNMQFKHHEEIPERYIQWMDKVGAMFEGMDMFALDVMVDTDGREHIIEINDSSMGLLWEKEDEDNFKIRDLVIQRMGEAKL